MTTLDAVIRAERPLRGDIEQPLVGLFARMFPAYQCGSEATKKVIESMVGIVNDPKASDDEKHAALDTLVEVLFPEPKDRGIDLDNADEVCGAGTAAIQEAMEREQAQFANRLNEFMTARRMSQVQLAKLVGVGQPAISMMLKRKCRPQRSTVERIAKALDVDPKKLWP